MNWSTVNFKMDLTLPQAHLYNDLILKGWPDDKLELSLKNSICFQQKKFHSKKKMFEFLPLLPATIFYIVSHFFSISLSFQSFSLYLPLSLFFFLPFLFPLSLSFSHSVSPSSLILQLLFHIEVIFKYVFNIFLYLIL